MEIERVNFYPNMEVKQNWTRVKAFIINDKREILLALSRGACQLPGGHTEEDEDIMHCLLRELREETGIDFDETFTRFFEAHYIGTDKMDSQILYHYCFSNKDYDLSKTKHTDREKEYNFTLKWVSLLDLPRVLEEYRKTTDIPINIAIIDELKLAYNCLLKLLENLEQ